MNDEPQNLPAQIADALVSIPKGMVPGVVKALDRLLGAAVDVPVAWLNQQKGKIDAQTESYRLVEASIAKAAAVDASMDPETTQRAVSTLVRKAYQKQVNRDAVARAMVEELREDLEEGGATAVEPPDAEPDEDWLNVFERYAEDASSDRLQGLWGRVLAGEIRRPGKFSTRTLRFLSEFSQADALLFEHYSKIAFGVSIPKSLAMPDKKQDQSDLFHLEASGIIQGVTGLGLHRTLKFGDEGKIFLAEDALCLMFVGEPGKDVVIPVISLTPLGQQLLCLVSSRDAKEAAKKFANAIKQPSIQEAYLGYIVDKGTKFSRQEILWLNEMDEGATIEGKATAVSPREE